MSKSKAIKQFVESIMEGVYETGFNGKLANLKAVLDGWDNTSNLLRERLSELYAEKRDGTGDP